ncbi:hypothetical protein SB6413_05760 [Klebsiella pasteurii]|nr:hypothetical protein SB6413_05760 [Klebsiella pasteurii]
MFITTRQAALLLQVNEGELIYELERTGLFKGCQIILMLPVRIDYENKNPYTN